MPNTFGKLFSVTTWGESHGLAVGAVVEVVSPVVTPSIEGLVGSGEVTGDRLADAHQHPEHTRRRR